MTNIEPLELGYRPVPWYCPPSETWPDLPADSTPDDGDCSNQYGGYRCTRYRGHAGTCRAGDWDFIVAEWNAGQVIA